jgi:hypothetical protein
MLSTMVNFHNNIYMRLVQEATRERIVLDRDDVNAGVSRGYVDRFLFAARILRPIASLLVAADEDALGPGVTKFVNLGITRRRSRLRYLLSRLESIPIPPLYRAYVDAFCTPKQLYPNGPAIMGVTARTIDSVALDANGVPTGTAVEGDPTVLNLDTDTKVDLLLNEAELSLMLCEGLAASDAAVVTRAQLKKFRLAIESLPRTAAWASEWPVKGPEVAPEIYGLWLQMAVNREAGAGVEYQYPARDDEPMIPVFYQDAGSPWHATFMRPTVAYEDVIQSTSPIAYGGMVPTDDTVATDPSSMAILDSEGSFSEEPLNYALSASAGKIWPHFIRAKQALDDSATARLIPVLSGYPKVARVPFENFVVNTLAMMSTAWFGQPYAVTSA